MYALYTIVCKKLENKVKVLCYLFSQKMILFDFHHIPKLSIGFNKVIVNSSKKVLQFKFDLLYITLFSVFSTKIGIIRKLV